jgi:hypothetical protein
MMRRTARRLGFTLAIACATALATALPAFAKGPTIPVHITVSVTGPDLAAPVTLRWGGNCPFPEFCGSNGNTSGLDGVSFLNSTGVLGRAITGPGPASTAVLGPKYEVTYRAVSRGVVMIAHQDLYPFGPGTSQYDPQRPWVHTEPGQRLFTAMVQGGWIMAPTSLVSILRDHGFTVPAPPPSSWATAPAAAANAQAPAPRPNGPAPWALALGAVALASMVIVGAVIGRNRSPKRAVRPAATP